MIFSFVVSTLLSCGGPNMANPAAPLAPARETVRPLLTDLDESYDQAPFRFLDPWFLAKRPHSEWMEAAAYTRMSETAPEGPKTSTEAFDKALQAQDWAAAKKAAQKLADEVLGQPSPLAAQNNAALQRAVEFLELAPALGTVDAAAARAFFLERKSDGLAEPLACAAKVRSASRSELKPELCAARAASLSLVVLREQLRTQVPDGFARPELVDEQVWSSLLGGHDAWLKKNAAHPLADLARLQKLRVLHLKGDDDAAWNLLLELYARRPARAIWEMRHLLVSGNLPPAAIETSALKDPVLATALLRDEVKLTAAQWAAHWKRSLEAPKEAWALNLQERLFLKAESAGDALPTAPALPNELWAQLHTMALLTQGKVTHAWAQAQLLEVRENTVSALLYSQAAVANRRWAESVAPKGLPNDARFYLLQVVMPDSALRELKGPEAELAKAMREVAANGWSARLEGEWLEGVKKSKGPQLAFARWLKKSELFPARDPAMSRALKQRLDALTNTDSRDAREEKERLTALLLRGGAREQALEAYAQALATLEPKSKDAKAALSEADALYNQLLNWDAAWSTRYPELLKASAPAVAIREAGKKIRAK